MMPNRASTGEAKGTPQALSSSTRVALLGARWYKGVVIRFLVRVLCLMLFVPCCHARLGETIQQIEARYGKPLKGMATEYPATVAGVYAKPGFQIVVGFRQNKSYYEKIQKIDPQNPKAFADINAEEQVILLKANCSGCNWQGQPTAAVDVLGTTQFTVTTYNRSDGLAKAVYDTRTKVLTIRLLEVEKADEAKRKQQEGRERPEGAGEPEGF